MNTKIWLGRENAHIHTVNHQIAFVTDPMARFDAYVEVYDGSHVAGGDILLNTTLSEVAKVVKDVEMHSFYTSSSHYACGGYLSELVNGCNLEPFDPIYGLDVETQHYQVSTSTPIGEKPDPRIIQLIDTLYEQNHPLVEIDGELVSYFDMDRRYPFYFSSDPTPSIAPNKHPIRKPINVDLMIKKIIFGPDYTAPAPPNPDLALQSHGVSAADPVLARYQELGLHDRRAYSNVEASLKLLVERGIVHRTNGELSRREFANHDFRIVATENTMNVSVHLDLSAYRFLHEDTSILVADSVTGDIHQSNGTLEHFGKLQNLANGQALVKTYPHCNSDVNKSAAQKSLQHLDETLTLLKGKGTRHLAGPNHYLQRCGDILHFSDKDGNLLLAGNVHSGEIETSYLSSKDAFEISYVFMRVSDYHFDEPKSTISPLSTTDLDYSWTVPEGEQQGIVDQVTDNALVESATVLQNHKAELTDADDTLESFANLDSHQELHGQSHHSPCPPLEHIDISTAQQLMVKAQHLISTHTPLRSAP